MNSNNDAGVTIRLIKKEEKLGGKKQKKFYENLELAHKRMPGVDVTGARKTEENTNRMPGIDILRNTSGRTGDLEITTIPIVMKKSRKEQNNK